MNPRTALILAGLALVVGVVGLVIGISAKNGNKSDQDIADATKSQLEQQLGTTASQAQGAEQQQASKEAGVTASVDRQLRALRQDLTATQNNVNQLDDSKVMQANQLKNLQDQVDKLDTRVANLEAK
jgi:flagellar biosynthesis chaperone FliJ